MQPANHLRVSSNELTALLKRVFEALACDQSAQEDAAKAIVAAESRGLPALDTLPDILLRLQREQPAPSHCLMSENDWLEIDGNQCSAACYASVFSDLVAAHAKQRQECVFARVTSCHDSHLLPYSLLSHSASGVAMLASWASEQVSEQRCAFLASPGGLADQYLELVSSEKNSSGECLLLIAAPDVEGILPHWQQIQAASTVNRAISSEALLDNHNTSLRDGIRIQTDLWEQLQQIALNVLVPSSERSRAGAGA